MGKDLRGVERGACREEDCDCDAYVPDDNAKANKCDYCGHYPTRHVNLSTQPRSAVASQGTPDAMVTSPAQPQQQGGCTATSTTTSSSSSAFTGSATTPGTSAATSAFMGSSASASSAVDTAAKVTASPIKIDALPAFSMSSSWPFAPAAVSSPMSASNAGVPVQSQPQANTTASTSTSASASATPTPMQGVVSMPTPTPVQTSPSPITSTTTPMQTTTAAQVPFMQSPSPQTSAFMTTSPSSASAFMAQPSYAPTGPGMQSAFMSSPPSTAPPSSVPISSATITTPSTSPTSQCPMCGGYFPCDKIEAHASNCDGTSAPPPSSTPLASSTPAWPADAVEKLAEQLPKDFPKATIQEMLNSHPVKGDMDTVLAMLFAAADQMAKSAPPPTVAMDEETRRVVDQLTTPTFECGVCLETFPVTGMYTVDCPSAHRYCFDCISRFITMKVNENAELVCPAAQNTCKHILGEGELKQIAKNDPEGGVTPEIIKKYEDQQLLRGIQSIPGVIGCPTPQCPNWVVPNDTRAKERCVCGACKFNFCSLCKKLYHYHCSCAEVFMYAERWVQWCTTGRARYNRGKSEALARIASQRSAIEKRNTELKKRYEDMVADEKFKAENGRHCPKCKRVIVKEGGCDSMVCGRDYHGGNVQDGCGHHFNWESAKHYTPAAATTPDIKPVEVDIPDIAREVVHQGVFCDRCRQEIRGLRVSCLHCPAQDLCERCEIEATPKHPHDHVFRVFTSLSEY